MGTGFFGQDTSRLKCLAEATGTAGFRVQFDPDEQAFSAHLPNMWTGDLDQAFLEIGTQASGVADYVGIDPVIVRLLFVLLTLWQGWGLLIYFVLAIVMPVENDVPVSAKANAFDDEEIIIKDA